MFRPKTMCLVNAMTVLVLYIYRNHPKLGGGSRDKEILVQSAHFLAPHIFTETWKRLCTFILILLVAANEESALVINEWLRII